MRKEISQYITEVSDDLGSALHGSGHSDWTIPAADPGVPESV